MSMSVFFVLDLEPGVVVHFWWVAGCSAVWEIGGHVKK